MSLFDHFLFIHSLLICNIIKGIYSRNSYLSLQSILVWNRSCFHQRSSISWIRHQSWKRMMNLSELSQKLNHPSNVYTWILNSRFYLPYMVKNNKNICLIGNLNESKKLITILLVLSSMSKIEMCDDWAFEDIRTNFHPHYNFKIIDFERKTWFDVIKHVFFQRMPHP